MADLATADRRALLSLSLAVPGEFKVCSLSLPALAQPTTAMASGSDVTASGCDPKAESGSLARWCGCECQWQDSDSEASHGATGSASGSPLVLRLA